MKIRVLGCSGGIGGKARNTTALLVDNDTLIDCGTGLGALDLAELMEIDRIFVTHSHLDHIALLPMLVDTVGDQRTQPITVFALEETHRIMRSHIFNWLVWPDFTAIPDRAHPFLSLQSVKVGEVVNIGGGRSVTALPAHHSVPSAGYSIACAGACLAFTGDTSVSEALVDALNDLDELKYLLIETAFPNSHQDLAMAARHLSPAMLHRLLDGLTGNPEVLVTHLKPVFEAVTKQEVLAYDGRLSVGVLEQGQEFEFQILQ